MWHGLPAHVFELKKTWAGSPCHNELSHQIHRIMPPRDAPPHSPEHLSPLLLLLRIAIVIELPPLLPMILGILTLLIARRLLHLDLLHRHSLRFQRALQLSKTMAQQAR